MSLTADDRVYVDLLFQFGPDRLIVEGMSLVDRDAFLKRDDVRDAIRQLARDYQTQEGMEARVKYATKRRLFGLATRAVGVLEDAMNGVRYARDTHGNVIRDSGGEPVLLAAEVSDARQLRAAEKVLDLLGVGPDSALVKVEINTAVLLQQERTRLAIEQDKTLGSEEEKGIARERVRVAMEKLVATKPALVARAMQEAGMTRQVSSKVIDAASNPKARTKATRRKKSTKKKTAKRKRSTKKKGTGK